MPRASGSYLSLQRFAIASHMANFAAGMICLHMFCIVTHKILANTYFFSLY